MVLSLVQDSHSEQVWKKSLQPSPRLSALGGLSTLGTEFEVHGCLLHAATGQLVPEGLRNHTRPVKPVNEEQELTFGDITVGARPRLHRPTRTSGAIHGHPWRTRACAAHARIHSRRRHAVVAAAMPTAAHL